MRRGLFPAALLLGLLIRAAALPLPGTEDVRTWKVWAFAASAHPTYVYGVGGHPPVRGVLRWGTRETTVDYPPLALYELALVGRVYRLFDPTFGDSVWLVVLLKLPGLIGNALLAWLMAWTARRFGASADTARWAALAWWLNPASILDGEVLGYLDPLMMLPAIAALVLLHCGAAESAGLAFALAVLTKPQAVLLAPAFALAAWHAGTFRIVGRVTAGGALATAIVVLPFALEGALGNMWLAFGSFYARRDILSGNAANLWWIANWALRGYYQIPALGLPGAFLTDVRRIMAVSTFEELGFPNPRPFATAAVVSLVGWSLWRLRSTRDLAGHALAAAFTVHAFFVLAVGVHEHHLMLAVPLLLLASALEPTLRPLFYTITAIVTLNLNLFYGIGIGWGGAVPRLILGVDLTVLLSVANVAALVWHAQRATRYALRAGS